MKIDLRGNIKTIGAFYLAASWNKNHGRELVHDLVTVETEEPWRRGRGWGILVVPRLVIGVGRWEPDEAPNMEYEAREALEQALNIPRWHRIGTLHEDTPQVSEQLPDGWTYVPAGQRASIEGPAEDQDAPGPGSVLLG